jgi:NAD(P)H-nitrite reductase large subunit
MGRKLRDDDLVVCRCEEITKGEIREVIRLGVTRMNEVKRLTRAGQGLCQGKTCGRLVLDILARETNQPLQALKPATSRPPTRVLPLGVLASSKPGDQ